MYVCVGGLVLLKAANGRCRTARDLEIGSGRAWLDVWQGAGRVSLLPILSPLHPVLGLLQDLICARHKFVYVFTN